MSQDPPSLSHPDWAFRDLRLGLSSPAPGTLSTLPAPAPGFHPILGLCPPWSPSISGLYRSLAIGNQSPVFVEASPALPHLTQITLKEHFVLTSLSQGRLRQHRPVGTCETPTSWSKLGQAPTPGARGGPFRRGLCHELSKLGHFTEPTGRGPPASPRGWHSLSSPCGFDGARAQVLLRALDPHRLSMRRECAATHHV